MQPSRVGEETRNGERSTQAANERLRQQTRLATDSCKMAMKSSVPAPTTARI